MAVKQLKDLTQTTTVADDDILHLQTASGFDRKIKTQDFRQNIRYSKIDNPLVHLFKTNKLVDTLAGNLTVSRSTTATYVDIHGVVKTAAIDEPREEKEGNLIEGSSTNYAKNSNKPINSMGGGFGSVSDNTNIAPNDVVDGQIVTYAANAYAALSSTIIFTSPSGLANNYSVYLRLPIGKQVGVRLYNNTTASYIDSGGKLYTGTGDWERVENNTTGIAAGNAVTIYIWFEGVWNVGDTYEVWGTQIEPKPFATSYMPTTTAPVTRAQDLQSIPFYNNYANKEVSVCMGINYLGGADKLYDFRLAFQVDDGNTFGNRVTFANTGGNSASKVESGGGTQSSIGVQSTNYNGSHYNILTLSSDAHKSYTDGILNGETNSITLPLNLSRISLGSIAGVAPLYGHIKDLRIYDFTLNQDEVRYLSGV